MLSQLVDKHNVRLPIRHSRKRQITLPHRRGPPRRICASTGRRRRAQQSRSKPLHVPSQRHRRGSIQADGRDASLARTSEGAEKPHAAKFLGSASRCKIRWIVSPLLLCGWLALRLVCHNGSLSNGTDTASQAGASSRSYPSPKPPPTNPTLPLRTPPTTDPTRGATTSTSPVYPRKQHPCLKSCAGRAQTNWMITRSIRESDTICGSRGGRLDGLNRCCFLDEMLEKGLRRRW